MLLLIAETKYLLLGERQTKVISESSSNTYSI